MFSIAPYAFVRAANARSAFDLAKSTNDAQIGMFTVYWLAACGARAGKYYEVLACVFLTFVAGTTLCLVVTWARLPYPCWPCQAKGTLKQGSSPLELTQAHAACHDTPDGLVKSMPNPPQIGHPRV